MEERDNREENKKRALIALAMLIGASVSSFEELAEDKQLMKRVEQRYESSPSLKKRVERPERVSEQDIQREMAKSSVDDNVRYMKVTTFGDDKVCEKCREWQDKIVTVDGSDSRYPSVNDFIKSGGLHYNCRCSLQELGTKEIPLSPLNPRHGTREAANPSAYNSYIDLSKCVFN